ncbi:Hypothetical predicted protein [Olea europaea subsp. europaea]|uniref:Uncharacterized protein n=1 Tax=Olea europaea subsp. europaea TaxID=158383 RepID=A0A8S0T6H3_OLEEU|nr:Hypothetical predicted protein [Olea europaea subsp. europaea]
MEEDFDAENLEDGELWLPSDFFSMDDVQASTNFNSPLNYYSTSKPRCMEDLAQRFSDFNVRQRPNISKSLQGFKPDQYRSTVSRPVACFGCSGGGWLGSSPVYPYQFLNPVQSLVKIGGKNESILYLLHSFPVLSLSGFALSALYRCGFWESINGFVWLSAASYLYRSKNLDFAKAAKPFHAEPGSVNSGKWNGDGCSGRNWRFSSSHFSQWLHHCHR